MTPVTWRGKSSVKGWGEIIGCRLEWSEYSFKNIHIGSSTWAENWSPRNFWFQSQLSEILMFIFSERLLWGGGVDSRSPTINHYKYNPKANHQEDKNLLIKKLLSLANLWNSNGSVTIPSVYVWVCVENGSISNSNYEIPNSLPDVSITHPHTANPEETGRSSWLWATLVKAQLVLKDSQ